MNDQNRERFETLVANVLGYVPSFERDKKDGKYLHWPIELAWSLWQDQAPKGYKVVPVEPTDKEPGE